MGFQENTYFTGAVERLTEGDEVFFYATAPVRGVIGFGKVRTKFVQDRPLWPKEVADHRVIWPLRFEVDTVYVLPEQEWTTKTIRMPELRWRAQGGLVPLPQELATQLRETVYPVAPVPAAMSENLHERTKQMLREIGRLQGYVSETEYDMNGAKLDVVWRRVEKSVPTYAFEIQIGGNLYQALAKLKHAFDLWNSHIFLVGEAEDHPKVESLLAGTFHEVSHRLRFVDVSRVEELYKVRQQLLRLEEETGLRV